MNKKKHIIIIIVVTLLIALIIPSIYYIKKYTWFLDGLEPSTYHESMLNTDIEFLVEELKIGEHHLDPINFQIINLSNIKYAIEDDYRKLCCTVEVKLNNKWYKIPDNPLTGPDVAREYAVGPIIVPKQKTIERVLVLKPFVHYDVLKKGQYRIFRQVYPYDNRKKITLIKAEFSVDSYNNGHEVLVLTEEPIPEYLSD